jgi:hypothetical protein
MKKLLASILMLAVVFGMSATLTGCGDGKKAESPKKTDKT